MFRSSCVACTSYAVRPCPDRHADHTVRTGRVGEKESRSCFLGHWKYQVWKEVCRALSRCLLDLCPSQCFQVCPCGLYLQLCRIFLRHHRAHRPTQLAPCNKKSRDGFRVPSRIQASMACVLIFPVVPNALGPWHMCRSNQTWRLSRQNQDYSNPISARHRLMLAYAELGHGPWA